MNENDEDNMQNASEEEKEEDKKEKIPEEVILDNYKSDETYYYPENYNEKIRVEENIPSGIPFQLRKNIDFLNDEEIIYSCGNTFQILNINTLARKVYPCQDIKGIGCLTVSKDKRFIAVGECGHFPNILVYTYNRNADPNLKLYRIMRKGTENVFSAMCFNEEGNLLASAGSDPDHNLIIWNWKTESIILKAKAFSQEVFSVCFSDNFEGKLITSGMGHIKFWEMAKTFTGLKLQGELGKFGQVDLSDVTAFLEFPDGKILCGTEQGTLILWEGIFIKTQVFIKEDCPCHGIMEEKKEANSGNNNNDNNNNSNNSNSKVLLGSIEANQPDKDKKGSLEAENDANPQKPKQSEKPEKPRFTYTMLDCMFWEGPNTFITTGHDGFIKWWKYSDFENAEIDDFFRSFITPIKIERLINPITNVPVKIVSVVPNYTNKMLTEFFNKEQNNKEGKEEVIGSLDPKNLFWIVQDGHGYILNVKLTFENNISRIKDTKVVVSGFAGSMLTAVPLERTPYTINQAADSKICLVNNLSPENPDEKVITSFSSIPELEATACHVLTPISEADDPLILLTGFSTGLVRVHSFNPRESVSDLINQIKVHDKAIRFLKASPDRSWLLSATQMEIFIQLIQSWNNITPLFFIKKEGGINDVDWQSNSKHFLLALEDGSIEQVSVQAMPNNSETYEIQTYDYKKMFLRHSYKYVDDIDDKKKKKFKQTEEACKGRVYSVKFAGMLLDDDFFVTCCEPYEDFIFLCSFDIDKIPNHDSTIDNSVYVNLRPTQHWKIHKMKAVTTRVLSGFLPRGEDIKFIKNELHLKLVGKDFLVIANMNGQGIVQIHHKRNLAKYIELFASPANNTSLVNAFCYSNLPIVNLCFNNGTVVSYIIDLESMTSYIDFVALNQTVMKAELKENFNEEEYEAKLKNYINTELLVNSKLNAEKTRKSASALFPKRKKESLSTLGIFVSQGFPVVDIQDLKTLQMFLEMRSLEKIKKDAELEAKQKKADEKKNRLREKISALREDFQQIVTRNTSASEEVKLLSDEMVVDDNFIESIVKKINEELDDVRHKYDWEKEKVQGTINRLEEFFLKSVKTHVVKLYTLSRERLSQYVTSIRCPALPNNFDEALSELEKLIEEYKSKISFEPLEKEYERHMLNTDGLETVKEEDIAAKINLIKARIEDFIAKTDTKSGERVNFGKDQIKAELDVNALDMKELEDFKRIMDKTKPPSLAHKKGSLVERKVKCPDRYTLKINYDVFYTEELMKTTFEHKLEILNFLKVLYEQREEFNSEVFKLREKKMKIIQEVKLNKQKLIAINNELGIRTVSSEDTKLGYENTGKYVFAPDAPTENLDWLNLEMKDVEFTDNFLRIKAEELEVYVQEKYKLEKKPCFVLSQEESASPVLQGEHKEKQQQEKQDKPEKPLDSAANLAFPFNAGNFSNPQIYVYSELKVNFKDRGTKKQHDSVLFSKMKEISQIKLNYKKKKLIEESKEMVDNFDKEIKAMRKKKLDTHFKQKLGELELFIKHEEYNILRAFETDDKILIEKLEELCQNYRSNLSDLNAIEVIINELEQKVKQKKAEREEKIAEFYKYIEAEKENKSRLEKIYFTKTKKSEGKEGEERLDNDEDLENDRPKNVTPTMFNEIILKRENRETLDNQIENFEKGIESNKKTKQNRIQTKLALDKKREDIRMKINAQERKKSKYLNLIEISFPIKIDQFCKFRGGEHDISDLRLSLDISQAILISRNKLKKLDDLEDNINVEIEQFRLKENKIAQNKVKLDRDKKQAVIEEKECRDNFIKEQNLKFGTEINFDNLLKAARDTTANKLDFEYKQLKKDADILIDNKKELEDTLKKDYQNEVNVNTALLHKIKKLLNDNKQYDRSLEEKNNEINKKKEKKYEMFNVQEKKEKLKEILRLLQQQMEALKKENEIFRKKGGHIYSTITSNLN